ncbi:olfactory receptor 2D3-like [Pleurodeles waltl]|uniref:olfactory receptor 2D3-like n=1 Tax=Pleurodeles waltl TaxID=8319 RepID=UPI0037099B8B
METNNGSVGTGLQLVGLSEDRNTQISLFVLFTAIYLITLIGNMTLVTVCICDPHLHTPMYFFLANLSLIDVCYSSAFVPNMLANLAVRRRVSFAACGTQLFTFLFLGCTESAVLLAMAYDRYVAISLPLRYTLIMRKSICITMAACCWIFGSFMAIVDTVTTLQLPLCGHNVIDHFFCEPNGLIKIACTDTFYTQIVIYVVAILVLVIPSVLILLTYICILITVVGMSSSMHQYKVFSTCASHLVVVTIFYSSAIFMYMKPVSKNSGNREKIGSLFYTVTPPMFNPMIYSLRNKDVKVALHKVIWSKISPIN